MRTSNVRLVFLHATRETKAYLDAIDPVDAEDKVDTQQRPPRVRHEEDAAGCRRDREFLVHCFRFLAALKTRLALILAKTAVMRVMINALRVALAVPTPIPQCLSLLSLVPAW